MLHNICMSAVAMSLRWANRGPWASCFFFFSDFLYKSMCCGYSFALNRQVDATHNICLYEDVDKKYTGCIIWRLQNCLTVRALKGYVQLLSWIPYVHFSAYWCVPAGWMAKCVDLNELPHPMASKLGLHCFLDQYVQIHRVNTVYRQLTCL